MACTTRQNARYVEDDALGEAYDKTARLLGLNVGGGGGPTLEALAKNGDPKAYRFPVPLRQRKNCDFSYAGLKTAVRMAIERDLGVGDTDAFTKVHTPGATVVGAAAAEEAYVLGQAREERDERTGGSSSAGSSSSGEGGSLEDSNEDEEKKRIEEARREQIRADIAASFQQSAVKHLEARGGLKFCFVILQNPRSAYLAF